MTLLFQNKYRIKSARHPEWDYTLDNEYFITICTYNREEYFGNIINEKMELNDVGKIIADEWVKTGEIRKNVTLDEWIIMPNHFHGIIVICNDDIIVETPRCGVSDNKETPQRGVSTITVSPLMPPQWGISTITGGYNPKWQPNSLGSIINQFKSICTKRIRKIDPNFAWQSRFHDRIVRNECELNNIRNYIYNNPYRWELDRNSPENVWM